MKIDTTILKANNIVKSLLSSFLQDLKTEQKKEKYIYNNIDIQLKEKKAKISKKKSSTHYKKKHSNMMNVEVSFLKIKKVNTISCDKYYKKENKNTRQPPTFKKRTNTASYYPSLQDNLPNFKIKYSKNYFSDNNSSLMNKNIEKSGKINKKNSIDIQYNHNELSSVSDIEKEHNNYKTNSTKKPKKYKKAKRRNSIKKSIGPKINSSLYSKLDMNTIINEKPLKTIINTHKKMVIEEMIKEPNYQHSLTNSNSLKYYHNYFNNSPKHFNMNCYTSPNDKAKSEPVSPKKDLNINNIKKIENIETFNYLHSNSAIYNLKGNSYENIRRMESYLPPKIFPIENITKKKLEINVKKLIH